MGLVKTTSGSAVFWQTEFAPLIFIFAVGVGKTVTVVDAAAEGPLQPLAVTLTVAMPENVGAHVTVPVVPVPEIVFPVPLTVQV
jgi:hypothetical protein